MKTADVGKKVLNALAANPGEMSISQISAIIGSSKKATNAALGRLFKKGLVDRPQKGIYSHKRQKTVEPAPKAETVRPAEPVKTPEIVPAPVVSLSVITIELLVEGEEAEVDASAILGKISLDRAVLDARVTNITPADQKKLRVRFSFQEED